MKRRGGFNAMDPARAKEIQSLGGKAAHAKGVAPKWNSETGRAAGKKGGGKNSEANMIKRFGRVKWAEMQEAGYVRNR